MTFDPEKPVFAGKLRLQTTNRTGVTFFLSYTTVDDQTAPTLSSAHSTDPTTLWTSYDAGSGSVVLVSDAGLYVSVHPDINLALLVRDATAASPVTLVPGAVAGQVTIAWSDPASGKTLTAYYQLSGIVPATLVFAEPGGSGGLTALARTITTPGLAAIQSSKSATGYDLTGVNLAGAG